MGFINGYRKYVDIMTLKLKMNNFKGSTTLLSFKLEYHATETRLLGFSYEGLLITSG